MTINNIEYRRGQDCVAKKPTVQEKIKSMRSEADYHLEQYMQLKRRADQMEKREKELDKEYGKYE